MHCIPIATVPNKSIGRADSDWRRRAKPTKLRLSVTGSLGPIMRRVVGISAVVLSAVMALTSGSAFAARKKHPAAEPPPPTPPPYNWSGFYIGGNVGFGQMRDCWDFVSNVGSSSPMPQGEGCNSGKSKGLGGGQIGYNWQMANWILGLEASGDFTDFNRTTTSTAFSADTIKTNVNSIAFGTARLGYAWNAVMIYGKGGIAWSRDKYERDAFYFPSSSGWLETANVSRPGWVAGGGLEYALNRNWSAGIEYDYAGFGKKAVNLPVVSNPGGTAITSVNENMYQDIQIVTLRLSFRWGVGQ